MINIYLLLYCKRSEQAHSDFSQPQQSKLYCIKSFHCQIRRSRYCKTDRLRVYQYQESRLGDQGTGARLEEREKKRQLVMEIDMFRRHLMIYGNAHSPPSYDSR